jgi:hypothetical protein
MVINDATDVPTSVVASVRCEAHTCKVLKATKDTKLDTKDLWQRSKVTSERGKEMLEKKDCRGRRV